MNHGMLSFEDALTQLLAAATVVSETEIIATNDAVGRVLACDVISSIAVPPLDNSAMDGYALRAGDVQPGMALQISQRIAAGQIGSALLPGTAARIFTGAPLPQAADVVVMQEHCAEQQAQVFIKQAVSVGQNIRRRGEDIAIGATVLRQGMRLGAAELGVAASVGLAQLTVFRKLKVALFSTGDELTLPGEGLKPGGIYNSNRTTLHALLHGMGCVVTDFGIVPDKLESTRRVLREAAQDHDLILTSGGVSVGEEDHVKPAVAAEGEITLWKIAIKPGKPLAHGKIVSVGADDTPFIGLPGNPVASFVTFLMLVRPYLLKAQGHAAIPLRAHAMRADFSWPGDKRREFLRVRRNDSGGLDLFPNQSSGVLTSCAWADGLVSNPPDCAIEMGDSVEFLPFAELGVR